MKIFGNCCKATDVVENAHSARPRSESNPTGRAATPRPGLDDGSPALQPRRQAPAPSETACLAAAPRRAALSANKQDFLASRPPEQQLTLEQIQQLAAHYQSKLGVAVRTSTTGRTAQVSGELQNLAQEAQSTGKPIAYLFVNKRVGYLDAEAVSTGKGHVDAYVATPNGRVLNLVAYDMASSYNIETALTQSDTPVAVMDFNRLLTGSGGKVHPQGGQTECGSLGLASMKEYLKNNGEQLAKHSLVLCTGSPKAGGAQDGLMIPSPQALRYSQSDLAVKVAHAVVTGTDAQATVEHRGEEYTVKTLAGYAQDGVPLERPLATPGSGSLSTTELDSFRQQWAAAYDHEMTPKREAMRDSAGRNAYLAQVQHRHNARAPQEAA